MLDAMRVKVFGMLRECRSSLGILPRATLVVAFCSTVSDSPSSPALPQQLKNAGRLDRPSLLSVYLDHRPSTMPRQQRGGRGKGGNNGGNGANRAAPYEARQGRKGANAPANAKGGNAGGRKGGRGASNAKPSGKGGRGGRGGRGAAKPKPKTAEDLDREMDSYWGKSEEHAAKKLDSDMDDYWKNKDAVKPDESAQKEEKTEEKTEEAPAAEAATEDKAE